MAAIPQGSGLLAPILFAVGFVLLLARPVASQFTLGRSGRRGPRGPRG